MALDLWALITETLLCEVVFSDANIANFTKKYGITDKGIILDTISRFNQLQSRLVTKDIFGYTSFQELINALETLSNNERKTQVSTQVTTHINTDKLLVIEPLSMAAAIKYGKNTKWCTTSKNTLKNWWESMTRQGSRIIYIIDKQTNQKFAIVKEANRFDVRHHFEAFDANNDRIDAEAILNRYGLSTSIDWLN